MRIKVKPSEGKITFRLWFPTSIIKSNFITKQIQKYCKSVKLDFASFMPTMYKSLKSYIRHNGHFVLVDVVSSEGDKIIIKV